MANTPATIDRGKEAWETYVTQRTKANPKNSLFGTTLEHVDKGAVSTINAAEYETNALTQRHVKASQYDHKLPSRLQNKAAKDQLQVAKEEIGKKEQELNNRQAALSDMEKRAKYYASVAPSLHKDEQLKKKLLLAEPGLDFELVNKMNNVGYAKINTYNKDKHRERPPAHKYAVIGDPLEYGMDFSLHQTETHEKYKGHIPISEQLRHHRSLRQYKSAPPTVLEKGAIPANIRAKYRSYLVDELFADQEAVDKVKHQLNEEKIRQQRRHEKTELPPVVLTTPKNYGDLSHALRQDKFGGYSFLNASLMKDSHTQQVFDRRYRDPDEFRHTWDEYGKWKEKELCREKMDRDYEEFLKTLPKLEVNWDRNAVGVPRKKDIPVMQPPKKAKPRNKPVARQPKRKQEDGPAFEEVVFITPPMTPEPQHEQIMPVANNTKDDEFWKFYDQGLPPIK